MAGGLLIVLGLNSLTPVSERGIGSGIHGGEIINRGTVDEKHLGVGAKQQPMTHKEREAILPIVMDFAQVFGIDPACFRTDTYTRIIPASARPFANKYSWE
jgi:glutamate synthase domain-containing protein 3